MHFFLTCHKWLGSGEPKAFWQVLSRPGARLGVWADIAGAYDQKSRTMTLYLNGQEVGREMGVQYQPNDRNPTRVGAGATEQWGASPCFFCGKIAEVHVWDRVLTPKEIQALSTQQSIEVRAEPIRAEGQGSQALSSQQGIDPARQSTGNLSAQKGQSTGNISAQKGQSTGNLSTKKGQSTGNLSTEKGQSTGNLSAQKGQSTGNLSTEKGQSTGNLSTEKGQGTGNLSTTEKPASSVVPLKPSIDKPQTQSPGVEKRPSSETTCYL